MRAEVGSARLAFCFSSRRRRTWFSRDWSSDVCSSDLGRPAVFQPDAWFAGPAGGAARRLTLAAVPGPLQPQRRVPAPESAGDQLGTARAGNDMARADSPRAVVRPGPNRAGGLV